MKPSTEKALWANGPLAVVVIGLIIFGIVTWPRKPEPTPPIPRGKRPVVEEPVKLAKVVAECRLRITREELLMLAEDCRSAWRGVSLASYDDFACFPGEGFDERSTLPDPLYTVDLKTYRHTKPGTVWID